MAAGLTFVGMQIDDARAHARISPIIDWMVACGDTPPAVAEVAARAGMDIGAFEAWFAQNVGITPQMFIIGLQCGHVRNLAGGRRIAALDEVYAHGLSGAAPLYEGAVTICEATPDEMRARGAGMAVQYGFAPTPFGELILARTPKGLAYLGFAVDEGRDACLERIFAIWRNAELVEDNAAVAGDAQAVVDASLNVPLSAPIALHLYGTPFQIQVWRAMLKIPRGAFVSYDAIGRAVGREKASQAVGGAVGANPVSLLIPCHRVLQKNGLLENYGWGSARKKALLAVECAA